VDLHKIRQSKIYRQILSLGYKDVTSSRQEKTATLALSATRQFITVHTNGYIRLGKIRSYSNGIPRYAPIRDPKSGAFTNEEEYVEGLQFLFNRLTKQDDRQKKAQEFVLENAKVIIRGSFEEIMGDYWSRRAIKLLHQQDWVDLKGLIKDILESEKKNKITY
jgi:hypothetical protein